MSRHRFKDACPHLWVTYHPKINHISRAVFPTFHFAFIMWLRRPPSLSLSLPLSPPALAFLPHFCPPLLPPLSSSGDSGQAYCSFPLLMASPCYCGQTPAVNVLVAPGLEHTSLSLKHQAKLRREENNKGKFRRTVEKQHSLISIIMLSLLKSYFDWRGASLDKHLYEPASWAALGVSWFLRGPFSVTVFRSFQSSSYWVTLCLGLVKHTLAFKPPAHCT